ncbi:MAG: hypothetical protein NTX23_02025 [Candidatus Bipolaricaulota bacterium]|nr:hypothetical protein [Candidatus Bipolaricaulota bacterium]
MLDRTRVIARCVAVVLLVVALGAVAQGRDRVALFVQAAAAVPTADLELVRNYAAQQCSVISGGETCSQGDLMLAQRAANAYVGNSLTVDAVQRLASNLGADHIVILRIVSWENDITFRPERSLLLLGATSFLDTSLKLLISPLGLLFGIERKASVSLFATVFSPRGDVEFTTTVSADDRPLFSLLTADPVEAAKKAVDAAMYQIVVVL